MSAGIEHLDCYANRNTLWAALFAHALSVSGLRDVCLSPGSRSAPLALAFAAHPKLRIHLLIDERSAAFFALGLIKAHQKPAAVLCTSGTAPANFLPALVEASLSCLPLLAISADRPPSLQACGATQTTAQPGMFAHHVRWHIDVGEPRITTPDLLALWSLAPRLLKHALQTPQGPVHANFPFRKPLEPSPVPHDIPPPARHTAQALFQQSHQSPQDKKNLSPACASANPPIPALQPPQIAALAQQLAQAQQGIIICGAHTPIATLHPPPPASPPDTQLAEAVTSLAQLLGWPILAEPSSGIWRNGGHPNLIAHSSTLLQTDAFQHFPPPQYILRLGITPVDAGIQQLLNSPVPQTAIDPQGRWNDPQHHPQLQHLQAEPRQACKHLHDALTAATLVKKHPQWLADFTHASHSIQQTLRSAFQDPPPQGLGNAWFEGRVIMELAPLLPAQAQLFCASSLLLRDLCDYWPQQAPPIIHLANRGANGIDGILSTALGAAAHNHPTFLLIGDTALLHDSNALHFARHTKASLKILLLNNNGGGIFHTLPIHKHPYFHQLFQAAHHTHFPALAQAHHIPYHQPQNWEEFTSIFSAMSKRAGVELLEISLDPQQILSQRQLLHQRCSQQLSGKHLPPITIPK